MAAESNKRFRDKLHLPENAHLLAQLRERRRRDGANYRQRQLQDPETAEKFRERRRAATQLCRDRKLKRELGEEKTVEDEPGFSSKSGLRRAVKKIEDALPKSQTKAIEVLKTLCKKFDLQLKDEEDAVKPPVKKARKSFIGTTDIVHQYYELETVSRLLPDEYVYVEDESGERKMFQKRVMLMPVKEAYNNFQQKYPNRQISSSKFHMLRPLQVITAAQEKVKAPLKKEKQEVVDDYGEYVMS